MGVNRKTRAAGGCSPGLLGGDSHREAAKQIAGACSPGLLGGDSHRKAAKQIAGGCSPGLLDGDSHREAAKQIAGGHLPASFSRATDRTRAGTRSRLNRRIALAITALLAGLARRAQFDFEQKYARHAKGG